MRIAGPQKRSEESNQPAFIEDLAKNLQTTKDYRQVHASGETLSLEKPNEIDLKSRFALSAVSGFLNGLV
jgi:hypothetical protein